MQYSMFLQRFLASACALLSVILLLSSTLLGQAGLGQTTRSPKELQRSLVVRYKGKVLSLRNFYKGDFLRYTKEGRLIRLRHTGSWTLYIFHGVDKATLFG